MQNIIFSGLVLILAITGGPAFGSESGAAGTTIFNYNNYADNAPGTEFLERGNRFYRQGDYDAAVGNFQLASHWGDKMGQFNLGLLYVNGQGVERNPLRGWAWIELAAERGYPHYRQVADGIWGQFEPKHRKIARRILEDELRPEYGDEVAIERTSREMKRRLRKNTSGGSRVGANRVVYVEDRAGNLISGHQYFHPDRWDFEKIIQFETRLIKAVKGGVRIREVESRDDEEDSSDSGD